MWHDDGEFEKWIKTQLHSGVLDPLNSAFEAGARSKIDLIDKLTDDNKKLEDRQKPLEKLTELVFRLQQFPNEDVFIRPEIENLLRKLGYK